MAHAFLEIDAVAVLQAARIFTNFPVTQIKELLRTTPKNIMETRAWIEIHSHLAKWKRTFLWPVGSTSEFLSAMQHTEYTPFDCVEIKRMVKLRLISAVSMKITMGICNVAAIKTYIKL